MRTSPHSAARLSRLIGLLLAFAACVSCKSSEGPTLGGETNWFAWCRSDADCLAGACVCGVCTASCSAEHPSCAAGPEDSSCFARGSFGHAALCGESSAEGVCLTACATDGDCREGSSCQLGACSLAAQPSPDGATGATATSPEDARLAALAAFSNEWFSGVGSISIADGLPCSNPDIECMTLEQVLSTDACYAVSQGCGIYYVGDRNDVAGTDYWYEGFGVPPIGGHLYSDAGGSGGLFSSRSLDCDAIETMCSTCGAVWGPACRDVPGAFPEPLPPAPAPGCSCEPDGEGAARVSLDCFCSVHECPESFSTAVDGCTSSLVYQYAGMDACGRLWFEQRTNHPLRFAFDAETGELVAALRTSGAPIVAPCNSYELRAGADAACEPASTCVCATGPDACDPTMWLGLLEP